VLEPLFIGPRGIATAVSTCDGLFHIATPEVLRAIDSISEAGIPIK